MTARDLKVNDLIEKLENLDYKDPNKGSDSYNENKEISQSMNNFEYVSDGDEGIFEQPLQLNSNYYHFFIAIIDLFSSGKLSIEQVNSYLSNIDYSKFTRSELIKCNSFLVKNFKNIF